MSIKSADVAVEGWKAELPTLTARMVTLREVMPQDLRPLTDILSVFDAARFGIEDGISEVAIQKFIDRAIRNRAGGLGFTYAIVITSTRAVVGLMQVRQLDPVFESAEWEFTLVPSWRGSGVFLEAARLVGSFVFGTLGTHRVESRVPIQNGRGNGALRKLGAVQEGILRRSLRRDGQFLDQVLWSILKEDWGEHWVSTAPRVH